MNKRIGFSIIFTMVIVSNLFTITLVASRDLLSSEFHDPELSCYFTQAPASKEFKSWRNEVLRMEHKYNLGQYIGDWVDDTEKLEKLLKSLEYSNEEHRSLSWLIEKSKVQTTYTYTIFGYSLFNSDTPIDNSLSLVSIGNLSSGKFINVDPVMAVIDELYREYLKVYGALLPCLDQGYCIICV